MLIYLKFIILLSIIIYLFAFIYLKIKHPFWFHQPVSQHIDLFKKDGIITQNIPKIISIQNFKVNIVNTNNNSNIDNIKKLLNDNYNINQSYKFNYDEKYLNWSINVPYQHYNIKSNNIWSLGIYDNNNRLIAFINGKPIHLYLDNLKLSAFYIDYLCIDKKYRKQNLAQSIITHMANNGFVDNFKLFIFKKELFPLPFKYISKYNYFLINTKKIISNNDELIKINDTKINENKIEELYNFYLENIKNNRLYNLLFYQEFKHYISNNISLYTNKKGRIDTLIAIYDSKINYNNTKSSEFLFIIIRDKSKYTQLINEVLKKESHKYNYSLINDTSHNELYIKENNLEMVSKCYLHFYNYHYNKLIKNNELSFNIP